ncbi:MAG: PQQ-binding-like beta-propeller repeat protein [Tistlia sp.]
MTLASTRLRIALACCLALGLGGCSLTDDWFGTPEAPPLPGVRLDVLTQYGGLEADPAAAAVPLSLPPAQSLDWPQAGSNAAHDPGHRALESSLSVAWRADIGEGNKSNARLLAQPVVAEGRVYTLDSISVVSAFDARSGNRIWRLDLAPDEEDDGFYGGGLAYDDGRLFVTTGFGAVFALEAGSGELVWQQRHGVPIHAAPTVSSGRVFVITVSNEIRSLAADDGRLLWTGTGLEEQAGLIGAAAPVVSGATVIAPYTSGELAALRVENGRDLWNFSLAAVRRSAQVADIGQIVGLPVVRGDRLYAVSHSGRAAAIDLRRGQRAWEVEAGGIEMPLVLGNFLFLVTNEARVVAIVRDSGRIRWVTDLPRFQDQEDRTGPIRWFGPLAGGGRLLLASSKGELIFLDPESGEVLDRQDLPGDVAVAPVIAGGTLYLQTVGGDLIALR